MGVGSNKKPLDLRHEMLPGVDVVMGDEDGVHEPREPDSMQARIQS